MSIVRLKLSHSPADTFYMKATRLALVLVYVLVCGVGFLYFGPKQYTSKILTSSFYKKHLSFLDKLFWSLKNKSESVAQVKKLKGELRYQPQDVFVYLPAVTQDSIPDKSFLVTSSESTAWLKLYDDTLMKLDPNTTVYLEIPRDGEGQDLALSLQVLEGEVKVERTKDDGKKIEVRTKEGKQFVLEQKKIKLEAERIREIAQKIETEKRFLESQRQQRALASIKAEPIKEEVVKAQIIEKPAPIVKAVKVPESIQAPKRSPASLPSGAVRELPERNHITKAISQAKEGKIDSASRHMAESLTESAYAAATDREFSASTRVALDSLLSEQTRKPDCSYVKDTLRNVYNRYNKDQSAKEWTRGWVGRFRTSGCRF
jgi:hypothetical protein